MFFKYDDRKAMEIPLPFKRKITPIMMSDSGMPVPYSVHITEWDAGCHVDMHAHSDATEAMYCMSGAGKAFVGGDWYDFVPDSMIVAPEGIEHCIRNTGEHPLRVLCIFSPPVSADELIARALKAINASGDKGNGAE